MRLVEPSIVPRRLHGAVVIRALGLVGGLLLLANAGTAAAAAPNGVGFDSAADVKAQVEAMRHDMKPGQGFMWRPLVRGGEAVAALEYWKTPGKPAVHPAEAEYVVVIAGGGTMVSGGTMEDAKQTNPTLVEGSRIRGGTTRTLRPGDVFLIPAGTPHWFGITGERLVLLGTKLPQVQH
jgi:mannose-6-phosphate isomerase-like protein (cupin superfamily)